MRQEIVGFGIPGVDLDVDIDVPDVVTDVAKAAYTASKQGIALSAKLAADSRVQAAANAAFPGSGRALQLGAKAANLIGAATAGGSPAAKRQIAGIVAAAKAGNPAAQKANAVLRATYSVGKSKGAWGAAAQRTRSPAASKRKGPSYGVPLAAAGLGLALLLL